MKNLLIITYYWPPAGGAGVQRWLKFSKYLPEFGWNPIILTVNPDQASYPQRDESLLDEVGDEVEVFRTNSFEPLQLYAKAAGKERVPYGGFSNKKSNSPISRFLRGNFFIPDARRGWNRYAIAKAKEIISSRKIDCIVTTGPPQSTHLIGLSLKRQLGIKWGVDLRDPWTDIYYNEKMLRTRWAEKRDAKLEKQTLQEADFCITVSKGFVELFKGKVERDYELITNGYDDEIGQLHAEYKAPDKLIISYTGTMAESYHPDVIFNALSKLKFPFELRIAGNVSAGITTKIKNSTFSSSAVFLGYLPHEEVLMEMRQAHLLLLITPKVKNSEGIIPGKLFEYLGTGNPILAISDDSTSDVGLIIKATKSGKVFSRNEEVGVAEYLNLMAKHGFKSEGVGSDRYHRRKLTEVLAGVLDNQ